MVAKLTKCDYANDREQQPAWEGESREQHDEIQDVAMLIMGSEGGC